MRTSNLLGCAALAGLATASHDAYLWTVDAGTARAASNQVASIESYTAERILARRKGVSASQKIKVTDQNVLSDINRYGGWQQPLFSEGQSQQPAKVFIRLSGYSGTVSDFNTLPDLWVEQPESTLLDTFEAKFSVKNTCEYHIRPKVKADVSMKYTYHDQTGSCILQSEVEMLPSILAISATIPSPDKLSGKGISSFHRTLVHLAATENLESTFLVLPITSKLKKTKKTELKKREETPLEFPPVAIPKDTFLTASNTSSNFTLPRFVPQYFTSKETCDNVTNSCMGHGKCVKAHGNQFRCKCSNTIVRTNDDGTTKSVQWGGNACQKKDVSSQFILFASVGVFFTAIVAGSIGMLFSMGSENLPSVIGAGVVGPRAQR